MSSPPRSVKVHTNESASANTGVAYFSSRLQLRQRRLRRKERDLKRTKRRVVPSWDHRPQISSRPFHTLTLQWAIFAPPPAKFSTQTKRFVSTIVHQASLPTLPTTSELSAPPLFRERPPRQL